MDFRKCCFLLIVLKISQAIPETPKIFFDFLNESKSSIGIIFYCNKSLDIKQWQNVFISEPKYLAFFDISTNNLSAMEMSSVMNFKYHKIAVVADLTCNQIEAFINAISGMNFFNASYYWLLLSDNYQTSVQLLERQNVNFDSEMTLAVAADNKFDLFDVYKPSNKYRAELVVTFKGIYDEKFKIILNGTKFQRRSDLRGIKINFGVTVADNKNQTLLEYLESEDVFFTDVVHRHHYRLFKLLAEKHNFSIFLHRGSHWGSAKNDMMEMYAMNQIDASITPLRVILERLGFVDFAVTTWTITPTIVFRHPKNSLRNAFLEPLSLWVWNSILIILFAVSLLITATIRCFRPVGNAYFVRAFMNAVSIMCQQGFMDSFPHLSTRVTILTFIFFSQIIYQFYSSFIVGSLLTKPPKTINNLRQLIDSRLEVGIEDVYYNPDFFNSTDDKLALELYNKKFLHGKSQGTYYPIDSGIALMQKGGFAFHFDTSYGYRLVIESFSDETICELHEMLLFPQRPVSVTSKKGSPFKELIMIEMLRFAENGILSYYNGKWKAKKPRCESSITKIKAIDLEDASWVFILLSAAIGSSLITVIIENIHYCLFYSKKTPKISKKVIVVKAKK